MVVFWRSFVESLSKFCSGVAGPIAARSSEIAFASSQTSPSSFQMYSQMAARCRPETFRIEFPIDFGSHSKSARAPFLWQVMLCIASSPSWCASYSFVVVLGFAKNFECNVLSIISYQSGFEPVQNGLGSFPGWILVGVRGTDSGNIMYQMETCTINASSTTSEFVLMCKVLMCVIDTFLWRSVQTHRQHKHTPCQLDERGYIYIYIYFFFSFFFCNRRLGGGESNGKSQWFLGAWSCRWGLFCD